MSKRYGRNQKRRHREQIRELELSVKWCAQGRANAENRLGRSQRDLLDLVGAIEGVQPFSALLPVKTVSYDVGPRRECARRQSRMRLLTEHPPAIGDHMETFTLDMREVEAWVQTKGGRERLEGHAHIRAGGVGHTYRIDARTMSRAKHYPQLIPGIAEEIARALLEAVKP